MNYLFDVFSLNDNNITYYYYYFASRISVNTAREGNGIEYVTVYVERRLPAEPVDQCAGQWHADHHARVRTTQGYGGQSRSLQRRRPVSPDAVTSRIRDTLWRNQRKSVASL